MSGATALLLNDALAKGLCDLRHDVMGLQARLRNHEGRLGELADHVYTGSDVTASAAPAAAGSSVVPTAGIHSAALSSAATPRRTARPGITAPSPRASSRPASASATLRSKAAASPQLAAEREAAAKYSLEGRLRLLEEIVAALSSRVDTLEEGRWLGPGGTSWQEVEKRRALEATTGRQHASQLESAALERRQNELEREVRLIGKDAQQKAEQTLLAAEVRLKARQEDLQRHVSGVVDAALSTSRNVQAEVSECISRLQTLERHRQGGRVEEEQHISKCVADATASLEAGQEQRLSPLVSELKASSRAAIEVRRRLSEFESHLESRLVESEKRQERTAAELGSKLRGELQRSAKLLRLEAAQTEGLLEARMEDMSAAASAAGALGSSEGSRGKQRLAQQFSGDADPLSTHLKTMAASVKACSEEQKVLAQHAVDREAAAGKFEAQVSLAQKSTERSCEEAVRRSAELQEDCAKNVGKLEKRLQNLEAVDKAAGSKHLKEEVSEELRTFQKQLRSLEAYGRESADAAKRQAAELAEAAVAAWRPPAGSQEGPNVAALWGRLEELESEQKNMGNSLDLQNRTTLRVSVLEDRLDRCNIDQLRQFPELEDRLRNLSDACQAASSREAESRDGLRDELRRIAADVEELLQTQALASQGLRLRQPAVEDVEARAEVQRCLAQSLSMEQSLARLEDCLRAGTENTLKLKTRVASEIAEARKCSFLAQTTAQEAHTAARLTESLVEESDATTEACVRRLGEKFDAWLEERHESTRVADKVQRCLDEAVAARKSIASVRADAAGSSERADSRWAELRAEEREALEEARHARQLAQRAEAAMVQKGGAEDSQTIVLRLEAAMHQLRRDLHAKEQRGEADVLALRQEVTGLEQLVKGSADARATQASLIDAKKLVNQAEAASEKGFAAALRSEFAGELARLRAHVQQGLDRLRGDIASLGDELRGGGGGGRFVDHRRDLPRDSPAGTAQGHRMPATARQPAESRGCQRRIHIEVPDDVLDHQRRLVEETLGWPGGPSVAGRPAGVAGSGERRAAERSSAERRQASEPPPPSWSAQQKVSASRGLDVRAPQLGVPAGARG
eukprot:TRINITY_DN31537_c0_g1_i1.p1 TRINITY_DN31537_c0_g1~~TRINITY_DN31537_c0_g1_i1.p1  ORF type:complete len:1090 (-),score=312.99 TRINITY_DN31537_c0_g1_i1:93-3362(-)